MGDNIKIKDNNERINIHILVCEKYDANNRSFIRAFDEIILPESKKISFNIITFINICSTKEYNLSRLLVYQKDEKGEKCNKYLQLGNISIKGEADTIENKTEILEFSSQLPGKGTYAILILDRDDENKVITEIRFEVK